MALTRATVGGKVTASIINGIIDNVEGVRPHMEFTQTSASTATATTSSVGSLVIDTARSNSTTMASVSTNTITIAAVGVYALDYWGTIPVPPTGLFFVRATVGTAVPAIYGSTVTAGVGGSLFSNIYIDTAGTVVTLTWFHASAASRVLTGRFQLTKMS